MRYTVQSASSRVNVVVGPLVVLIGVAAGIAAIVLSLVLESAWFLVLSLPALMAIGAGTAIFWGARRAGLRIDEQGFTWCGFLGASQSLRWEQIHQLVPPAAGSPRTVLVAQLRDGRQFEVRALWQSPTSPASLFTTPDHSRAQNALLSTHRAWLASHR